MTQSRAGGRGRNAGHEGRGAANDRGNCRGRGAGYTSKPKTLKVGLCKELENHIFDYGVHNAADLMRTTQKKIAQYVGIKYGEDIANELTNKTTVTVLAGKVANMSATCRPDSQKSALLANAAKSCRHKFVPDTFLCRGLPTFSKFPLSTRGTYGVIIVQTGMYSWVYNFSDFRSPGT